MCAACDAAGCYRQAEGYLAIETVGFGYLMVEEYVGSRWRTVRSQRTVSHTIYGSPGDPKTTGPLIPVGKLLAYASSERGDVVLRACWPCVVKAIPDTAEQIAGGTLCQEPTCLNRASTKCDWCGAGGCGDHSAVVFETFAAVAVYRLGNPLSPEPFPVVEAPPSSICRPCIYGVRKRMGPLIVEHGLTGGAYGLRLEAELDRNRRQVVRGDTRKQRALDEQAITNAADAAIELTKHLHRIMSNHDFERQKTELGQYLNSG